jgi:hypothetical protein
MRFLRLLVIPVAAVLVLATAAAAAGPIGTVAGYYTYLANNDPAAPRTLAVASGEWFANGTWTRIDTATGEILRSGQVSCLVIDGDDAWMAGPETYRAAGLDQSAGSFLYVHGPRPGSGGDSAVTWFGDPGQPLTELLGWCRNKATHVPLFPLTSGDVDVFP